MGLGWSSLYIPSSAPKIRLLLITLSLTARGSLPLPPALFAPHAPPSNSAKRYTRLHALDRNTNHRPPLGSSPASTVAGQFQLRTRPLP
ncbi:hypothetical protein NUW54_g13571 [Trametes sanguinea]|uniref:Uncharacterized protein n=1 Tax=Trametes sanguinea TaxID=158606 RepID=A0ACC1MK75_9APHY|nr:hypothetical protein NUW54_g13571 [Trametes sanguinea]